MKIRKYIKIPIYQIYRQYRKPNFLLDLYILYIIDLIYIKRTEFPLVSCVTFLFPHIFFAAIFYSIFSCVYHFSFFFSQFNNTAKVANCRRCWILLIKYRSNIYLSIFSYIHIQTRHTMLLSHHACHLRVMSLYSISSNKPSNVQCIGQNAQKQAWKSCIVWLRLYLDSH